MSKSGSLKGVAWAVCLISLGFILVHLAWERCDGLGLPDRHTPLFLKRAVYCLEWFGDLRGRLGSEDGALPPPLLKLVPRDQDYPLPSCFDANGAGRRGEWIPPSLDYPPLVFLVSATFMGLLGPEVVVARLSLVLFVVGLIALMARIGWQAAGTRGGILMALGTATAVWTSHYTRVYCMEPGLMFILALMLTLLLDSQGLTRPRTCVAIGVALGVGMLIKYSVLAVGLPVVVVAALPTLFASRRSVAGLLALVALLAVVGVLTVWGIRIAEANPTERYFLPLVLASQVLFGLALLATWALSRRGEPTSGVGLLTVASVAGSICCGWYFSRFQIWKFLVPLQTEFAPALSGRSDYWQVWPLVWAAHQRITDTFYWGGMLWLGLGAVMLGLWGRQSSVAGYLFRACLLTMGTEYLLLWPDVRYLAPMLPVLVILAFLWAARWRATFASVATFMVVVGTLQMAGWAPAVRQAASAFGLRPVAISDMMPDSNVPADPNAPRPGLTVVPMAEAPSWTPCLFTAMPPGSRVGYLRVNMRPWSEQDPLFFRVWLSTSRTVVLLPPDAPPPTSEFDYIVLVSWDKLGPEAGARLGLKGAPTVIPVKFGHRCLFFHLYSTGRPAMHAFQGQLSEDPSTGAGSSWSSRSAED